MNRSAFVFSHSCSISAGRETIKCTSNASGVSSPPSSLNPWTVVFCAKTPSMMSKWTRSAYGSNLCTASRNSSGVFAKMAGIISTINQLKVYKVIKFVKLLYELENLGLSTRRINFIDSTLVAFLIRERRFQPEAEHFPGRVVVKKSCAQRQNVSIIVLAGKFYQFRRAPIEHRRPYALEAVRRHRLSLPAHSQNYRLVLRRALGHLARRAHDKIRVIILRVVFVCAKVLCLIAPLDKPLGYFCFELKSAMVGSEIDHINN